MRRAARVLLFLSFLSSAASGEIPIARDLSVEFQGQRTSFAQAAVFAMPGETIEFRVDGSRSNDAIKFVAEFGKLERSSDRHWRWTAPDAPGSSGVLKVTDASNSSRRIELNTFVLVPAQDIANGYVGDFRIDAYPNYQPAHGSNNYSAPTGFVKVTEANRDRNVSPRFKIGQFVSKQQGNWPKYVAPGTRLYAKLERLLDAVRGAGFEAATLNIMSGYRTPYYNRALGNVEFSRHIYGDAADVFVDMNEDGYMDDLNGDGVVNVDDAATMACWLEALSEQPSFAPLVGGLGIYDGNEYHGPFIHLDSRGHYARWGSSAELDADRPDHARYGARVNFLNDSQAGSVGC